MKGVVTTVLMIGGALAAGGAAAYLADSHIDKTISARRAQLDAQYQHVRVVVANADLRPGVSLSSQTVAVREAPRAFLHSDAVLADNWADIAGRVLARGVRSGEPILLSHLAHGAGAGFSSQLPAGMRALTFAVDEEASISGMLAPGDRIDILFTTASGSETITAPLLLNVHVIATGVRTTANEAYLSDPERISPYRAITVAVTAQDAAKITLAQDAGRITVVLRDPHDLAATNIARVTKATLLSSGRVRKVRAHRRPVEIILGGTAL